MEMNTEEQPEVTDLDCPRRSSSGCPGGDLGVAFGDGRSAGAPLLPPTFARPKP